MLKTEPDWAALPAGSTASVQRLLRRCLERDPRKRLRDNGDARLELEASNDTGFTPPARFASRPAAVLIGALALAALALGLLLLRDTGPVWSRSGDRLFFRQGRLLMAAVVASQPRLEIGTPEVVFDTGWELGQDAISSYHQLTYDVLPDGGFLMVKNEPEAMPTRINVIFNWFEELNRIVPVAR